MNRRIYTVYKIVRVDGDAYASISFCEGDLPYVRYRPGKWAYAPEPMRKLGYDLCVFRHEYDACAFAAHPGGAPPDWQLWRCDARGVRQPLMFSLGQEYLLAFIEAVLDGDPMDIETFPRGYWPPGTLFARAVRLVERVPWDMGS